MKKFLLLLFAVGCMVSMAAPQTVENPLRHRAMPAPCGISLDFKTTQAMPENHFRWQVLTMAADSAPAHFQIIISRRSKGGKAALNFKLKYSKQEAYNILVPYNIRPNRWYNAVVNFDGTRALFYLNGKLIHTQDGVKGLPRTWSSCVLGGYTLANAGMDLPGEVKNYSLVSNKLQPVKVADNAVADDAAIWTMCDNSGQIVKGSGLAEGCNGVIGSSDQPELVDAEWAGNNGVTVGDGKKVTLPASALSCMFDTENLTIEFEAKPLVDTANKLFRSQLFTINADSNPNHFQCFWEWNGKTAQKELHVSQNVNGKRVRFSGKADLKIQEFNKITIVMEKSKTQLYCNGVLIAEGKFALPLRDFRKPMIIGGYAFGNNMGFPGQIRNFTIIPAVRRPTAPPAASNRDLPSSRHDKSTRKLFSLKSTRGELPLVFFSVSGNWLFRNGKLCESSDDSSRESLLRTAVLKDFPHDYVLDCILTMEDAIGCSRIYVGGDGKNDGYFLEHNATDNGDLTWLRLYRLQNGKKILLAEKKSPEYAVPRGKRGQQLKFTIARKQNIIGCAVNDKFFISVADNTPAPAVESLGIAVIGRKIRIEEISASHYPDYVMPLKPESIKPQELQISHSYKRHAFYRNEKSILLKISIINRSPDTIPAVKGSIMLQGGDRAPGVLEFAAVEPGKHSERVISIPIEKLSPGKYSLLVKAGELTSRYDIFITLPPRQDQCRFLDWGSGIDPVKLAFFKKNNINGSSVTVNPEMRFEDLTDLFALANDIALQNNMTLGVQYSPIGQPPVTEKKWLVLRQDNTTGSLLDCNIKAAREHAEERMEKFMLFIKNFPAFKKILFSSEIENHMEFSYRPETVKKFTEALKFAPLSTDNKNMIIDNTPGRVMSVPESVKKTVPKVFAADNQYYRFIDYFWREGFGDNILHEKLSHIVKKHVPDMITVHDPFRDVFMFGRNRGLDAYGTWFYTHPDGGEALMAVESMLAAVRGNDGTRGFQFGPSLWLYSQELSPAKIRHAGTQPRATFMTALWLGLAAKPLWFEFYNIAFFMPNYELEYCDRKLLESMSDFSIRFAQPLMPAMKNLERQKNRTALFLGMANKVFSSPVVSGYGKAPGNAFLNLLWKAHVPSDCIFEDSIRAGELKNYSQVFLYGATHLPDDVYKQLQEFQRNGGKVVVSQALAEYFPGAVVYEPDLSKIRFSSYYYIKNKKGFDAQTVYDTMQHYAKEIAGRFSEKNADTLSSSSHELYLRMLEKGSCKYIFAKNDRRTYGDYLGKKYRAVFDGELPLSADIQLKISENAVVYEYGSCKKLSHTPIGNNKRQIKLDFAPGEGKVLMVFEQEIAQLKVNCTAQQIDWTLLDCKGKNVIGVQPIEVTVIDPQGKKSAFSTFTAAIDGKGALPLDLGINALPGEWKITVKCLASGKSAKGIFTVAAGK